MIGPSASVSAPAIRIRYNVNTIIDHLTGNYHKGKDGLFYLNGGLGAVMGYAGRANTFKSTLAGALQATASLRYGFEYTEVLDTELTLQATRIQTWGDSVVESNPELPKFNLDEALFSDVSRWNHCSSDMITGDQWWKNVCVSSVKERAKVKKRRETPFWVEATKGNYAVLNPWSFFIDSFSEFHTDAYEKKTEKIKVGESEGNTQFMDDARHKAALMAQMGRTAAQGGFMYSLVAHADDGIPLGKYVPSQKKLRGLKGELKLKGVPGRAFSFLPNSIMIANSQTDLLVDKYPEYPYDPEIPARLGDNDLQIVEYIELRGKSGATGTAIPLVFSQSSGFQPAITEYHFIKNIADEYGLISSGSGGSTKQLVLYPEVKFNRKTLRKILREDPKFRRALEITAAMAVINLYHYKVDESLKMDAEVVYNKVKDLGYDWNQILTETVDYWQFKDRIKAIGKNTLTGLSILHMANDLVKPKFLSKAK